MRGTSYKETLQAKEAYDHLVAMYGARLCYYRSDNGILLHTLFKETVQACGKYISY